MAKLDHIDINTYGGDIFERYEIGGSDSASDISYDNTKSHLKSTDVQNAIDETNYIIGVVGSTLASKENKLNEESYQPYTPDYEEQPIMTVFSRDDWIIGLSRNIDVMAQRTSDLHDKTETIVWQGVYESGRYTFESSGRYGKSVTDYDGLHLSGTTGSKTDYQQGYIMKTVSGTGHKIDIPSKSGTMALSTDISQLSTRIDNLVIASGDSPAEVVDAHIGADGTQYTTLKNRLDGENSSLSESITDLSEDIDKVKGQLTEVDTNLSKRITNLEYASKGILYREEVDSSEAITKSVDSGALPYASLDVIGAKSVVPKNIFDVQKFASTYPSCVTNVDNNEMDMISSSVLFNDGYILDEGTYTVSALIKVGTATNIRFHFKDADGQFVGTSNMANSSSTWTYVKLSSNTNVNKLIFDWSTTGTFYVKDMQIEKGSQATPYTPYFTGIKNANLKEIVSVGKNLFDKSKAVKDKWINLLGQEETAIGYSVSEYIKIKPSTNYFFANRGTSRTKFYDSNKNVINPSSWGTNSSSKEVYTTPSNAKYVRVTVHNDDKDAFMLIESSVLIDDYVPYKEITMPTANIISKYFPNGMKSAGSVYDYIDLVRGKAVKRVSSVDLGSLNWSYESSTFYTTSTISNLTSNKASECVLLGYENSGDVPTSNMPNKTYQTINKRLFVKDSAYTNASAFKSAMNGVMLYYELSEYIETDIAPEDIEAFKYLSVEGGGSLYFKTLDEFDVAIPTTETFAIKVGGAE